MKDRAPEILTIEDLRRGHEEYVKHEPRDAMYRMAAFLVEHFWGNPTDMADGLGVLLLTWNAGFYRYGSLDFVSLQTCIENNLKVIEGFRKRGIASLVETDETQVKKLFDEFLRALTRPHHDKESAYSPVAVAKTLHILAPSFFPLWDDKIAKNHGCFWWNAPRKGSAKYYTFMLKTKETAEHLEGHSQEIKAFSNRPILKLIDEYDYSLAKGWLK